MSVKRASRRKFEADPAARSRLAGWLDAYRPMLDACDELIRPDGTSPEAWIRFLEALAAFPDREFEESFALANRHTRDIGVSYRVYGDDNERMWHVSPIPLVMDEREWDGIAAGVKQRATLLESVLKDIYGDRRLVSEGQVPAAVIAGSLDYMRQMQGVKIPGGRAMHFYAVDLGRGPDGRWWVLGDRTQAPSGAGYALENRLVLSRAFPSLYSAMNVKRLAPFFIDFRSSLAASAERVDPRICLLTPGPYSETYFEQAHLARYLGLLLVEGEDLVVRDGCAYVRTIAGLKRADVIWRRVDADFIDPIELNSASRLGVPGLLGAMRTGGVVVANMPGSGVLESRALLGFLPSLCQLVMGEALKLPNIATWWCGQDEERRLVESRLDSLAIAAAFPGRGPRAISRTPRLIADLEPAERAEVETTLRRRPMDLVGQEVVRLSTTPIWKSGQLHPCPFVLRVYAVASDQGWSVMPGGFCRISDQHDARAIFMGEGAQAADVWIMSDRPVERVTLLSQVDKVKVRRIVGHLPSRAADNLFWLGRYLERAEDALRHIRNLTTGAMDTNTAIGGAGRTRDSLLAMLLETSAISERVQTSPAVEIAAAALYDESAVGSVVSLMKTAGRTAAGMRERLSEDFWRQLHGLETMLRLKPREMSEAGNQERVQSALQALSALSGLAQENMNRVAGWAFFDMGKRVERGVNTCRLVRKLANDEADVDDLDLLLDLIDSQITYRSRYLEGIALTPVRDLAMLDPYNPRSVAFQVRALSEHFSSLPKLQNDGMPEAPMRMIITLASQIETADAADLDAGKTLALEEKLTTLSDLVSDRYFLQSGQATPTKTLGGLA